VGVTFANFICPKDGRMWRLDKPPIAAHRRRPDPAPLLDDHPLVEPLREAARLGGQIAPSS
jgi:hypothetical protein